MPQTYKIDEKPPKFKFSEHTLKSIESIVKIYTESLSELEKIVKNPDSHIDDAYGVCNNRYKIRYITPSDIATFVSYVGRIVTDAPVPVENINDMEIMSVAMIQRFVNDNEKCIPFEDTNAYGANANFDQRNIDLGKLVIMCANEFYDTGVYSKSDMESRAKAMEPDVKLMADMKFDTKVKKLMDGIPKILSENIPGLEFDLKKRKLVNETISKFLETVCVINLITLEQMMAYCIPNKSFNVVKKTYNPNKRYDYDFYNEEITIEDIEDEEEFIEESVDLTKAKPVFVNLSVGGDNFVSKSIRNITGEQYSHSSIGFDVQLNKLYTFNGGIFHDNVYHWQKAGFQLEALRSSKYAGVRCSVYCVLVPNDVYDRMLKAAQKMEVSNAKYDYMACVYKALAKKDENPARTDKQKKQICSSFVNAIIAIAGDPLGKKEISSPGELGEEALTKPNQCFCIYDGPGDGYDPKLAQEKIEDFAKRPSTKVYGDKQISEQVVECYTECCLVKTNDVRIRSKIPFNCNMRDVVLQDLRPDFKDTESAIMFMISDERSPITSLLRKYRTIEKVQPTYRVLNMFMHLKPNGGSLFVDNQSDPYRLSNEIGKMHTDPNWLDKITYGNQFLDGNYRSDALGINKFTPMENTLNHLYSMYCGCGLKTNEELANHIVEVANVMTGIIYEYRSGDGGKVCNYEMLRDILATLGEILTRTMLKLYDNNSIVFTISDNMDNSAAPGYMYTESFIDDLSVYLEEAGPSIKVEGNKTGMAKLGANIVTLLQNFANWVRNSFSKSGTAFYERYKSQVDFVKNNPEDINGRIEKALGNGFTVNLTNYKEFKVQFEAFGVIKKFLAEDIIGKKDGKQPAYQDVTSMLEAIETQLANSGKVEGLKNRLQSLNNKTNVKEESTAIINEIFYGTAAPQSVDKPLDSATWKSIINNIQGSKDLAERGVGELTEGLNAAETKLKQARDAAKPDAANGDAAKGGQQVNGAEGATQQQTNPWDGTVQAFTELSQVLLKPLIDYISKPFFVDSYNLYESVYKAFKTKYDENNANARPSAEQEKVQNPTDTANAANATPKPPEQ